MGRKRLSRSPLARRLRGAFFAAIVAGLALTGTAAAPAPIAWRFSMTDLTTWLAPAQRAISETSFVAGALPISVGLVGAGIGLAAWTSRRQQL